MKIKIEVEYDTDLKQFSNCDVHGEGIELKHSGSSYLRIKQNGTQIGTIGGHELLEGFADMYTREDVLYNRLKNLHHFTVCMIEQE